jgi:hypothetical protein
MFTHHALLARLKVASAIALLLGCGGGSEGAPGAVPTPIDTEATVILVVTNRGTGALDVAYQVNRGRRRRLGTVRDNATIAFDVPSISGDFQVLVRSEAGGGDWRPTNPLSTAPRDSIEAVAWPGRQGRVELFYRGKRR